MRYTGIMASAVLLTAVAFSSCTCHQQLEQPPGIQERPSGFHAEGAKPTPMMKAQAPTPARKYAPPQPTQAPGAQPALPTDFPQDVPVYKGAEVTQVQSLANNAHNVVFSTSAAVVDVYKFYQDSLTQAGWKVTQNFERPEHSFISFQKGDLVTNITIARNPQTGKQMIAIMYEKEKPLPFKPF